MTATAVHNVDGPDYRMPCSAETHSNVT